HRGDDSVVALICPRGGSSRPRSGVAKRRSRCLFDPAASGSAPGAIRFPVRSTVRIRLRAAPPATAPYGFEPVAHTDVTRRLYRASLDRAGATGGGLNGLRHRVPA